MFANIFGALSHVAAALFRLGDSINRFSGNLDALNGRVEEQPAPIQIPADISTEPVNRIAETNGRKTARAR